MCEIVVLTDSKIYTYRNCHIRENKKKTALQMYLVAVVQKAEQNRTLRSLELAVDIVMNKPKK